MSKQIRKRNTMNSTTTNLSLGSNVEWQEWREGGTRALISKDSPSYFSSCATSHVLYSRQNGWRRSLISSACDGKKRNNSATCGRPALILKNKKTTRCHLLFYCASYRLNMFRALLCSSSGARDYIVITSVVSFCKDGGGSVNVKLWFLVVYFRCEVLCRLVVAGKVFLLILTVVILYALILSRDTSTAYGRQTELTYHTRKESQVCLDVYTFVAESLKF